MANKMVNKKVTFDYYEVVLEIDSQTLIAMIKEMSSSAQSCESEAQKSKLENQIKQCRAMLEDIDSYSSRYTLEPILKSIESSEIEVSKNILGKVVELDVATFLPKAGDSTNTDIIYFQVTNCRDVNIPSKKKPGKDRVDIKLDDDEYIGEFMSILYNTTSCCLMVQLNKYALSISQLEDYFTALRLDYLDSHGELNEIDPIFRIALKPIMDQKALQNIGKQKEFTKFSIKCSDTSLRALIKNESSSLYQLPGVMHQFQGVNIDLCLSVDSRKKNYEPLDADSIISLFGDFQELEDDLKPNIEVHYKNDSRTDALNWILPKMQSVITFNIRPRTTLGYEWVYNKMIETFRMKQRTIISFLGAKTVKRE